MKKNKFMKRNKIFRILSVVAFIFLVISMSQPALAAIISDSSGDDTFSTANRMNIGDSVRGSITEMDDLDYYRFQLNSAGCVSLDMTSYMKYYCIRIYDSNGKEVWKKGIITYKLMDIVTIHGINPLANMSALHLSFHLM